MHDAPADTDYEPIPLYVDMRNQALALTGEELGIDDPIVAVLMETGYPDGVATVVAIADGSTSLYLSTGGGTIGAGDHPGPHAAALALVAAAADELTRLEYVEVFPLPRPDHTRFYVVTEEGVFTAEALEEDLGEGRHDLSDFFHLGHRLIHEIGVISQKHGAR